MLFNGNNDHVFTTQGHAKVTLASGIPYIGIAEYAYGVTDRFTAGFLAGPEGAGFKVVAAEVRNLSTQTAEAAQKITEGIAHAAEQIDLQSSARSAGSDRGASSSTAEQLDEIASHIETMSRTLGDVVPYLGDLSSSMDSTIRAMTQDVIDTLGDMQFQDITSQQLNYASAVLTEMAPSAGK